MNLDNWSKELQRRYGITADVAKRLIRMGAAIKYAELMNRIYGRIQKGKAK